MCFILLRTFYVFSPSYFPFLIFFCCFVVFLFFFCRHIFSFFFFLMDFFFLLCFLFFLLFFITLKARLPHGELMRCLIFIYSFFDRKFSELFSDPCHPHRIFMSSFFVLVFVSMVLQLTLHLCVFFIGL